MSSKCASASGSGMSDTKERFRGVRVQEEYDVYDSNPNGYSSLSLPFLKKRSCIVDIVTGGDIVIALTKSGICAAFSRETKQWICLLNVCPDELIRGIYYNKYNDSLITVSCYLRDCRSPLIYRSRKIECIRSGNPGAGLPLFESESLEWPGFVEPDPENGKVLTYSGQDSTYKVFDLEKYTMLYSFSDKNLEDIKFSPGIMLLIYTMTQGYVPLNILSVEDGTVLKSLNNILHANKKVDFIVQFNEKLLVKQEYENLRIVDVCNVETTEISETKFLTRSEFVFLPKNQLIMTLRNHTFAVWNLRGELVTSFEDLHLWHADCDTKGEYITSDENLIFSYCDSGEVRSINISNILTGKCVATVKVNESPPTTEESNCSESICKRIKVPVQESMEDITTIFYNEESDEIYTGNRKGFVHVWSN